jgi:hypothetical protein
MENNNNEKEENKNEIKENKDDNESENDYNRDDGSSGTNNNRYLNNSLARLNSELDLDKIIAGKDESQNNIANLNDILEEAKDEKFSEDNYMEGEDILNQSYLGNLFIDVLNKKKDEEKKKLRMSYFQLAGEPENNLDFGAIINAKLNEIKDKTLSFFDKTIKKFEKRYNDYISKMDDYIKENELKISKVFHKKVERNENILEFADNNIFKQFDSLIEIHENIINAIEDHIKLLNIFLQTDLIQQKNPLEYFINNNSNDILNCWFLNKINFQDINLSTVILNKDLSELCSRYLCKKKDNNFSSITIKKDTNGTLPLEADFVKENLNNLQKMKFININCEEMNSIFKNQNNQNKQINDNNNYYNKEQLPSASKLRSLSITDSNFSYINLTKIYAPDLQKLKLKSCPFGLSMKMFFDSILSHTLFLQNLYLQRCNLDDLSLSQIFKFLSENNKLLESLQNISFSGNEITTVNMSYIINNNLEFKRLRYLDFSKNNIYEFLTDNYKCLPEMKVLDLTDNNLSNYLFFQAIKSSKDIESIALLSNNIFINNNKKNADDYRKYFFKKISKFQNKIKKLNLTFLYNKEFINDFLTLTISPMVKISLIKLNLSYCGLSDDNLRVFLQNNFGLLNLEYFNLSNNFITIKIFNIILKLDTSIEKLNCLDLSMNDINSLTIKDYKELAKFVEKHSQLKKIKLQETTFPQNLLLLLENQESQEINKNLINKGIKFVVEKEHSMLIMPLKDLFEIKDKDY